MSAFQRTAARPGPGLAGLPGGCRQRVAAIAASLASALLWALAAAPCAAAPAGASQAARTSPATEGATDPAARAAALQQIDDADPTRRVAAVQQLAEHGTMADAEHLARALRDPSALVRDAATAALWAVWSRSGDAAVDRQLAEGTRLMSEGEFGPALAVFDHIVRTRPAFAEGWNKRATLLFLMGRDAESLRDCDEVLRRNPLHFGALSGMAQIHIRRGELEQALQAYERALAVNPNLHDGAAVLHMLEEAVREQRRGRGSRT